MLSIKVNLNLIRNSMYQLISKKGIKYFDVDELVKFLQEHPRLRYRVCFLGDVKVGLSFSFDV